MLFQCAVILFLCLNCSANENKEPKTDDYIRREGYPVEKHSVWTQDGFRLTLFRIPGSEGSTPIYLQHGLVDSSDSWFAMGRNHSLGFLLADEGFDVWAGNFRGNCYSRKHRSLSSTCAEYWDFSWDDLAEYDVRAMIDYILETTRQERLIHVGHSMGTTSFFVAASMYPEVNDKVICHLALAPITSFEYSRSPIFSASFIEPLIQTLQAYDEKNPDQEDRGDYDCDSDDDDSLMSQVAETAVQVVPALASFSTVLESMKSFVPPVSLSAADYSKIITSGLNSIRGTINDFTGLGYITKMVRLALDHGELRGSLARKYCKTSYVHELTCLRAMSVAAGDDEHNLTRELMDLMFTTTPKSSSLKEVKHYLQQKKAGRVFLYDYRSEEENMARYGTSVPPEVDFGSITVPVYFIYGKNDLFTSEKDVQASYEKLGNPAGIFSVKRPDWNHLDFLITQDLSPTLQPEIVLKIVKEYKGY